MGKEIKSIPKDAMRSLMRCPWRGNIRELANFIERAVILTRGDELEVPVAELATSDVCAAGSSAFDQARSSVIIAALKEASGRVSGKHGAAERLGLNRTSLQTKMRKLNIRRADYMA